MWNVVDRRVERSESANAALQLVLRSHRERGEFDLIFLTNEDGLLLASDGPRTLCEELAAYAPMLARGRTLAIDLRRVRGVSIHAFRVGRQELILGLRGGIDERLTAALALRSIQATTRILRG
jgi:hypothetical protein